MFPPLNIQGHTELFGRWGAKFSYGNFGAFLWVSMGLGGLHINLSP